jgi:hypothetical protein
MVRQRVRPLRASQTERIIDLEKQERASINLCVIVTLVCLTGFLIQFIGLRAMHWSASVGQLVAVMVMTIIREVVNYRRKDKRRPIRIMESLGGTAHIPLKSLLLGQIRSRIRLLAKKLKAVRRKSLWKTRHRQQNPQGSSYPLR